MAVRDRAAASTAVAPPRAMAWVVLLASAAAVLVVGLLATLLIFANLGPWPAPPRTFWLRFLGACLLTVISLSLRSLRWIFLLRRTETRSPIREAYIGYFAGLSLLVAPLLLGEIVVRSIVLRARGRVPILTTAVVNAWERVLDLMSLATIAAVTAFVLGQGGPWRYLAAAVTALMFLAPFRQLVLVAVVMVVGPLTAVFEQRSSRRFDRLTKDSTWLAAYLTSLVAWLLPGVGLWMIVSGSGEAPGSVAAQNIYATSTLASSALLAPAGVLVAGQRLLGSLALSGMPYASAALAVLSIRLATAGLSIALGGVFVLIHLRSASASSSTHFDDIADAYDVQIPESRRQALVERKTTMMREYISARRVGQRGLDVGCGQGAYVARMRSLGFAVSGIDTSAGQLALAAENLADSTVFGAGSVLNIPAADESFDFLYIINVLHHLASVQEQQRAFAELFRVLKPGGLLFVHEINTRNVLFRFYMGYVFPSLNCIDEGVERWLLPHKLQQYTDATLLDVRYFTFLPDFLPRSIVKVFGPIERMLERSVLRSYSAHYMAVFEKGPRRTQ